MPYAAEFQFHDILIVGAGQKLVVTRRQEVLAQFDHTDGYTVEDETKTPEQHMLLFWFVAGHERIKFFADHDGVQTNLREVDPSLVGLENVIKWLLPPGYLARQGDVGLYSADISQAGATEVAAADHLDAFSPILKRRHMIAAPKNCRFFQSPSRFFVRVEQVTQLIHPEHAAISLRPGEFELMGARGTVYPILQNVRTFRGAPLFA
jgi:hypothetical protein